METVVRSERRRVFRLQPGAWRDPRAALDHEDVLLLGVETASCETSACLVSVAVRHLLPEDRVRSWTVISVDGAGGLHRGSDHPVDPGLYARAVAWLWTAVSDQDHICDGAAYVETWGSESGAEAVACLPLLHEGLLTSVVAVWLTADDSDSLMRDLACLTLIGNLCAKVQPQGTTVRPGDVSTPGVDAEALTVRQMVILQAMARGLTNAQIAREINFSESTVRLESMTIYRYFGVHSRRDAVRAAQESGEL